MWVVKEQPHKELISFIVLSPVKYVSEIENEYAYLYTLSINDLLT